MKNTLTYNKGFLTVPVAILVAGIIVAGAIIFALGRKATPEALPEDDFVSGDVEKMRPVDDKDHIVGALDAPVVIVEYSDTECPFCKNFHKTTLQVVDDYKGKVAWVYRHFPLDAIHSQARKEAAATECAATLGGNDAFWKFINKIFEITPSNDGLDLAELPKIAKEVGLKETDFNKCLDDKVAAQAVEEDYQDGLAAGVQGTPHSIVVAKSGKKFVISGAQPLAEVKKVVEQALKE